MTINRVAIIGSSKMSKRVTMIEDSSVEARFTGVPPKRSYGRILNFRSAA